MTEPESGVGPRYDACLAALKMWRDGLVREARVPLGGIKDTDLHRAITYGRREVKRVATVLPATYRHYASAIVEVIDTADALAARSGPVPSPPSAPAPAPTSSPAPAATQPPPGPATPSAPPSVDRQAELERINRQFAQLRYEEELGTPPSLEARVTTGQVSLTWAELPDGEQCVYRVISRDDEAGFDGPLAPEYADIVAITEQPTALDTRPFAAAVRVYQVWRNSGATPPEAMAKQPHWHARGVVVAPVQNLGLQEDGGRVIGQWSVFPGVTRVHVYRIPIERAGQFLSGDPQYAIAAESTNLDGFVDRTAVRGQRYLYRCFAEATVNGLAQLSSGVGEVLLVSAVLNPVENLSAAGHGTGASQVFDLQWTEPEAGKVVIYRTPTGPTSGLENETRDEATLEAFGLQLEYRLRHPVQRAADRSAVMGDVPVPQDWERVYFTPVTLIDGKARVGRTVSKVVIGQVEDPVVVERTDHQVVKFGWPGEAAAVAVSLGPRGMAATVPQEGPNYHEISRDHYRRLGGLQFPQPLRPDGCSVHLAGISFVRGERIYGSPAVADYPGLVRLHYSIDYKRSWRLSPEWAIIRLWAPRTLDKCPPFVLVHHADRLPLSVSDGQSLEVSLDADGADAPQLHFRPAQIGPTPSATAFKANVRGRAGFLRVFADITPERLRGVAVIDPPVTTLMPRG